MGEEEWFQFLSPRKLGGGELERGKGMGNGRFGQEQKMSKISPFPVSEEEEGANSSV